MGIYHTYIYTNSIQKCTYDFMEVSYYIIYIYVYLFLYVIHTHKDYICVQLDVFLIIIYSIYIHLQYILYVMFYVYSSHLGDPTGNILVSMTLDLLSTGFSMGCDMS